MGLLREDSRLRCSKDGRFSLLLWLTVKTGVEKGEAGMLLESDIFGGSKSVVVSAHCSSGLAHG